MSKKNKEKKAKTSGAVKQSSALKWLLPVLVTGVAAIMLAGGSVAFYQNSVTQQVAQQQQNARLAQSVALLANSTVQGGIEQLALLAERADVNAALESGDLAEFNQQSHQWIPGSSLTLIPRRGADTSRLSYTAQDLLQALRMGKEPGPVVIAGNEPKLLFARNSQHQNGVLLLTRSLDDIRALARAAAPQGGVLVLSYAGVPLFEQGNANNAHVQEGSSGAVRVVAMLPEQDDTLLMVAAGAMAAGAVLLLLGMLVSSRLLSRAVGQDAAELIRYCGELARQPGVSARNHFHFGLFQSVTDAQLKLAEKVRGRGANARPVAEAQDAIVVDDGDDDGILLTDDNQSDAPSAGIFREYDIRGVAGDTLTAHGAYLIGRAVGSEAAEAGQQHVLVARDGRLSSPELTRALIKGLLESGRDVINLGLVPSPVLYYATEVLETRTGVMVTGSHNPPSHNGMKIIVDGNTLYGERITALYQRIQNGAFSEGSGSEEERDIVDRYLADVTNDIVLARPLRIAVDCGNGATGELAPRLFSELGCEVVPLFTDIDGNFPNHAPDPGEPENLAALVKTVKEQNLDLGLAFDGDGDRVAVVSNSGEIIWPDRLMMLFAKDLLGRSPGADILFDVKCSRALPAVIRKHGGRPMMYKTGHSLIKAKMKEANVPLAGEISGHIFFADRWFGCDDGAYAGARLLEILSLQDESATTIFSALKTGITTPALSIAISDDKKFAFVDALVARADNFNGGRPTTIDGLRVDFPDGWGLVRASNTTPSLVVRFEGRDEEAMQRVQQQFREQLLALDDSLALPF